MVMHIELKKLIKNIAVPLLVGLISGFLTRGSVEQFNETVAKPFFMPPSFLFPVVWTALYILMGVATYLIDVSPSSEDKRYPMKLFYVQLIFNFFWSFIFFTFGSYLFAFIWLIIMLVLIVLTSLEFFKIEPKATYCMIPYIIWVAFAGVLNFSIYLLN